MNNNPSFKGVASGLEETPRKYSTSSSTPQQKVTTQLSNKSTTSTRAYA